MTVRVPAGLDFRDISINEQENGELEDIVVPELIWTYLVHNGYEQAASSFQKSWSSHKSDEKPTVSASFKSIKHRKRTTDNLYKVCNAYSLDWIDRVGEDSGSNFAGSKGISTFER